MSRVRLGLLIGAVVSAALIGWRTYGVRPPTPTPTLPSVAASATAASGATAEDRAAVSAWASRFLAKTRTKDPEFYGDLFATPTAIADIREILADPTPLLAVQRGDIESDLLPPEIGERGSLLTLLDAVLLHPRAPADVRGAAVEALAAVVSAPAPALPSADALLILVGEKAAALASLARADGPDAARSYHAIADPSLRLLVRVETKRTLGGRGLSTEVVRRVLRDLEQGA